MTPVALVDALVAECPVALEGLLVRNERSELIAPRAYPHELPADSGEDDASRFPFVVVRFDASEQPTPSDPERCTVHFIIGTYDADTDMQGRRDGLIAAGRIKRYLFGKGVIAGQFDAQFPCTIRADEGDAFPYHFTLLTCSFLIPGASETEAQLNGII